MHHTFTRTFAPSITLSGIDERSELIKLASLDAEMAFLYTFDPEGRNRYPSREFIQRVLEDGVFEKTALHVCGKRARQQLLEGELQELVQGCQRIQINGLVTPAELLSVCRNLPGHTIITQYSDEMPQLLNVLLDNHAMLVDGSGGRGVMPSLWRSPKTGKPVGFAGGLGPENLEAQLPGIIGAAGDNEWWVDMESNLRTNDHFDDNKAVEAVDTFFRTLSRL